MIHKDEYEISAEVVIERVTIRETMSVRETRHEHNSIALPASGIPSKSQDRSSSRCRRYKSIAGNRQSRRENAHQYSHKVISL